MPYRRISSHQTNECNKAIDIEVKDPPGPSGASFEYDILLRKDGLIELCCPIEFHVGPMENGTNGLTHEALLTVLIDRLQCLQTGPFRCEENRKALAAMEEARIHLAARTARRLVEGKEGTHEV